MLLLLLLWLLLLFCFSLSFSFHLGRKNSPFTSGQKNLFYVCVCLVVYDFLFMLAWVDSTSSFLFSSVGKKRIWEYKLTCVEDWSNLVYDYTQKNTGLYTTYGGEQSIEREREVCRFFSMYDTLDSRLDWLISIGGVSDGLMMSYCCWFAM